MGIAGTTVGRREKTHFWCVQCGHACHCDHECFFFEPGKYRNNADWEWCHHGGCVHGKPGDRAVCARCGFETASDEAWKHDCRPGRPGR